VNDNHNQTYYILDLDRTLLNTDKAAELMRHAVSWHNSDLAGELAQRIEDYTLLGESFSMRDFIVERIGEDGIVEIEAKYKELSAAADVLNPGAQLLLDYLQDKPHVGVGILTFGSPLGQAMKIHAAGLAMLPFLVTGETFKGEQISSWRREDGLYQLPSELGGGTTNHIVFVDDKPFSFKGLAADCRGYWVKSLYDAGKEKLPSYVLPVESLKDIIVLERQIDKA
jgi:FMN phosphatase YigB (HAD superfamily)